MGGTEDFTTPLFLAFQHPSHPALTHNVYDMWMERYTNITASFVFSLVLVGYFSGQRRIILEED